jgi:hypothetical protein
VLLFPVLIDVFSPMSAAGIIQREWTNHVRSI